MATAAEVHLRPELWQGAQENQNLSSVLGTDALDWGDANANQRVQKAIESTLHAGNMRRSILPPPQPAPQWDELPFGVQWLIFKTVMDEKRSFTSTAMCILRLPHQQIWTFVEKYIAEWTSIHESRKKPAAAWSQQILTFTAQNPSQMMRKQPFPTRPPHAIDRLTSDDLRSGEAYLKRAGLVKAAALVRDWQNIIELNPLKLKIDNHILQRVRDLRLVNFAITKGWVSREQVDTQLVADCSIGAMSSSRWHEDEPIDEMFTTFTRSDIRSHTGQQAGAIISPPASVTATVPTGGGQFLESPSHLPQRLNPVHRPTDRVSAELSTAIRRISQQVPYEHVSGWLVRTCVEAGEAPAPCNATCATAIVHEGATHHPPAAKQGQHAQSTGSMKTGTLDVLATSAGTGVAQEQQTRDDSSHASQNSARAEPERKNGTTDLTGQMPSPGMEIDASGSQHRRAVTPSEDRKAPPRFAPRRQHSEAQQVALPAATPEPTPSETLRKLLKTRWAKYLKDEDNQPPEAQVAKLKKKKKAERDLPFEDDLDIDKIPEDDDDDDYIPGVNNHPKYAVPKGPKAVATPAVQYSPSPRKGSAAPRITLKRKEAPGTPSPAGARFTSGSHCHVDAKRRAQSHRASEHSEAADCPSNKRRKLGQEGNGNGNAVANTVHEALPRQSDTLFGGVLRHEVLPSIEGNAQRARFAWSADHAHYAGVATLAKQSYHADRLSMCPDAIQYRSSLWERGRLENQETMRSSKAMRELGKLKALKGELEIAEEANKGVRTGPAEKAKLAGCADTAAYAWQATEAYLAVVVGQNQVDPET